MDVLTFQEALEKLQSRAAAEHGIITSREVREAFDGIDLSDDQLMRVLAYLKVKGITIADIEVKEPEEVKTVTSAAEKPAGTPKELSAADREYLDGYLDSLGNQAASGNKPAGRESYGFRSKEEFIRYYLPKTAQIAASMNCEEIPFPDLLQEAGLALVDAAENLAGLSLDEELVERRVRMGIREAIERQLDLNDQDSRLISRVRSLDEKIRDLAEDDDGSIRFTMEELSVILDMDADEIRSVMKLIGDA